MKAIVLHVGCSKPNALLLNVSLPWPVYVNPGILLLLYYVLATLVKLRRSHFYTQVSPAGLVLLPLTLPVWTLSSLLGMERNLFGSAALIFLQQTQCRRKQAPVAFLGGCFNNHKKGEMEIGAFVYVQYSTG